MVINRSNSIRYDFGINSNASVEQNPDQYVPGNGIPTDDFVVARGLDLKPLSKYGENKWDWSFYTPHNTAFVLDFEILRGSDESVNYDFLIAEAKRVIFTIVWLHQGRELSPSTVILYLHLIKKILSSGADKLGLISALNDHHFMRDFVIGEHDFHSIFLLSMYNKLLSIPEGIGPYLKVKDSLLKLMSKISQAYYKNHKQHPPIPTRIYTGVMKTVSDFLEQAQPVLPELLPLVRNILSSKFLGRKYNYQREVIYKSGASLGESIYLDDMETLISKQSKMLKSYLESVGVDSFIQLKVWLKDIFYAVKITLLAYTGARSVEVSNLRESCLRVKWVRRKKVYIVDGISSKLNSGKAKKCSWVTNAAAEAIVIAKKVSALLYEINGERGEDKILMPIILYKSHLKDRNLKGNVGIVNPASLRMYKTVSKFRRKLQYKITEEDIQELELIDPFRSWREEAKFHVGGDWPLTAHQFRRSLALYASKSGLVSLPSLKRQLQHLTEAMSAYYSNGNASAINILDGFSDFVEDYNQTRSESEFVSYIKNVLMSDERLFGAHGNWINQGERKTVYIDERRILTDQFNSRRIAYQETILGGCTKAAPCKDKAMRNLVACLECSGSVIKTSRLDRVLKSQKILVARIDVDSIEYRMEKADLDSMLKYRERIAKKENS
jgi:integrase